MAEHLPALSFHETRLDLVEHLNGEPWLRGLQVASALGYRNPSADIANLYDRNAAEFTDSMTALVWLPSAGGMQETRLFSLRGAHLLGMFARTARAAEFRRWVLDVLERRAAPAAPDLASLTAERDRLRGVVIAGNPQYAQIVKYHAIAGLNHDEKARLMGWADGSTWRNALKRLAALGLIDYAPNPRLQRSPRRAVAVVGEVSHG